MNKIIKPINTEKATKIEEVKRRAYEIKREEKTRKILEKKPIEKLNNRYVFKVTSDANKIEIKNEIEKIYDVKVIKVNTLITTKKIKSRYTKRGQITGVKPSYKKAYVTLAEGYKIDIYNN